MTHPIERASVEQAREFLAASHDSTDRAFMSERIRAGQTSPAEDRAIRAIQQARDAGLAEGNTLRPIESAPRDGAEILAWREHSGFFQAVWAIDVDGDEVIFAGWWDPVADQEVSPTHWLPKPALSAESNEGRCDG